MVNMANMFSYIRNQDGHKSKSPFLEKEGAPAVPHLPQPPSSTASDFGFYYVEPQTRDMRRMHFS